MASDSGSPRRSRRGQCDGERVAPQDHERNQPPDGAFTVGVGADQLGDMADRRGLGFDLPALSGHAEMFRLQGCQAWESVELLSVALILAQHTDDLVDESSEDVF